MPIHFGSIPFYATHLECASTYLEFVTEPKVAALAVVASAASNMGCQLKLPATLKSVLLCTKRSVNTHNRVVLYGLCHKTWVIAIRCSKFVIPHGVAFGVAFMVVV